MDNMRKPRPRWPPGGDQNDLANLSDSKFLNDLVGKRRKHVHQNIKRSKCVVSHIPEEINIHTGNQQTCLHSQLGKCQNSVKFMILVHEIESLLPFVFYLKSYREVSEIWSSLDGAILILTCICRYLVKYQYIP